MRQFKVGDQVRMISKSIYGDLQSSAVYKRTTNGIGRITQVDPEGPDTYTVNELQHSSGGDFFAEADSQPINYGETTMKRRTFKLTKELPELTKGALVQEKCDEGTRTTSRWTTRRSSTRWKTGENRLPTPAKR